MRIEQFLTGERRNLSESGMALTLDQMNIKVWPDSAEVVNTLTFDGVVFHDDRRLTALFIFNM